MDRKEDHEEAKEGTIFEKIVVLDNLLLFPDQKKTLESLGKEVVYYKSSTPETLKEAVRKRDKESSAGLDDSVSPQCATELGVEMLAKEELARRVEGADCVLTCWTGIPVDILDKNQQIKYLGFWTHDKNKEGVPEAEARGVTVTYVPDYGTTAVAELVFSGVLHLARDIRRHESNTLKGKWPYEQFKKGAKRTYVSEDHEPIPEDIKEITLEGKTLGIVGMGRIGQKVAGMAKYGFGMDVVYASRTRQEELEKKHGYRNVSLDEVMESDVISIHVSPDAPRHMIDAKKIARIRDGAIIANTSVGHVLDQERLLEELDSGRFSAYLDVFDGLPPRKELRQLQKHVLSTYRAGWYTRDSVTRKGDTFIGHLLDYADSIRGNPC